MIRKESLRIGNLVCYDPIYPDLAVPIQAIRPEGVETTAIRLLQYEDIFPIPLSDDWLNKCGFTFHKSVGSEYLAYNGLRLSLTFYRWIPAEGYLQLDSPFGSAEIRFVHELMNWFFGLTGQEFKIKL